MNTNQLSNIINILQENTLEDLKKEYDDISKKIIQYRENGIDFNSDDLSGEPFKCLLRFLKLNEVIEYQNKINRKSTIANMRKIITKHKNEIIEIYGGKCFLCGFDYKSILCVHHIKPLSEGGDNNLNNLCVLCPNCHAIIHKIYSSIKKDNEDEEHEEWIKNNFTINEYNKMTSMLKVKHNLLEKLDIRGN